MRVVVDHSIIVIPENVQRILDILDNPACQSQHWARLQILLGGSTNFGPGFCRGENKINSVQFKLWLKHKLQFPSVCQSRVLFKFREHEFSPIDSMGSLNFWLDQIFAFESLNFTVAAGSCEAIKANFSLHHFFMENTQSGELRVTQNWLFIEITGSIRDWSRIQK